VCAGSESYGDGLHWFTGVGSGGYVN
jgi:hypothetical protein